MKPSSVNIRMYNVGFGDCFLLSFNYSMAQPRRHVLIDFGTIARPKGSPKDLMLTIANDIAATVGKEPFAVVATHRHEDHISGFSPGAGGDGPGAVIAALKPRLVVQPWTENLKHPQNYAGPKGSALAGTRAPLKELHEVACNAVHLLAPRLERNAATRELGRKLRFIGEDNIANVEAVKQLAGMAKNDYVYAGKKTRLAQFLPGVIVSVLGPPTIAQYPDVENQKKKDKEEYWHFQARAFAANARGAGLADGHALFPHHAHVSGDRAPAQARWLIGKQRMEHAEDALRIVTRMDDYMNNTSLILLFKVGAKKLLFPGDAQIENWRFALDTPALRSQLKGVVLYKVGHHGSLNATPKSIWKDWFPNNKKPAQSAKRMVSLMSTLEGKHGKKNEVPRGKLVTALKAKTKLISTQSVKKGKHWVDHRVEFAKG